MEMFDLNLGSWFYHQIVFSTPDTPTSPVEQMKSPKVMEGITELSFESGEIFPPFAMFQSFSTWPWPLFWLFFVWDSLRVNLNHQAGLLPLGFNSILVVNFSSYSSGFSKDFFIFIFFIGSSLEHSGSVCYKDQKERCEHLSLSDQMHFPCEDPTVKEPVLGHASLALPSWISGTTQHFLVAFVRRRGWFLGQPSLLRFLSFISLTMHQKPFHVALVQWPVQC